VEGFRKRPWIYFMRSFAVQALLQWLLSQHMAATLNCNSDLELEGILFTMPREVVSWPAY